MPVQFSLQGVQLSICFVHGTARVFDAGGQHTMGSAT
jgi:hypothetical protein